MHNSRETLPRKDFSEASGRSIRRSMKSNKKNIMCSSSTPKSSKRRATKSARNSSMKMSLERRKYANRERIRKKTFHLKERKWLEEIIMKAKTVMQTKATVFNFEPKSQRNGHAAISRHRINPKQTD